MKMDGATKPSRRMPLIVMRSGNISQKRTEMAYHLRGACLDRTAQMTIIIRTSRIQRIVSSNIARSTSG